MWFYTIFCLLQQLKPASLVESFELLDFYDEHLGHMMWYAPLFAAYLVYFYGSFGKSCSTGFGVWLLAIFGAGFEWYYTCAPQVKKTCAHHYMSYPLLPLIPGTLWLKDRYLPSSFSCLHAWFLLWPSEHSRVLLWIPMQSFCSSGLRLHWCWWWCGLHTFGMMTHFARSTLAGYTSRNHGLMSHCIGCTSIRLN